jgi:hypothetical protein
VTLKTRKAVKYQTHILGQSARPERKELKGVIKIRDKCGVKFIQVIFEAKSKPKLAQATKISFVSSISTRIPNRIPTA